MWSTIAWPSIQSEHLPGLTGDYITLIVLRKTIAVNSGVITSWWLIGKIPLHFFYLSKFWTLEQDRTFWKVMYCDISLLVKRFLKWELHICLPCSVNYSLRKPPHPRGGRSILQHVDRLTSQCEAMENLSELPEFKIYQRPQQGNSILRQTFISRLLRILQHWRQFTPVLFYIHYKVSIAVI